MFVPPDLANITTPMSSQHNTTTMMPHHHDTTTTTMPHHHEATPPWHVHDAVATTTMMDNADGQWTWGWGSMTTQWQRKMVNGDICCCLSSSFIWWARIPLPLSLFWHPFQLLHHWQWCLATRRQTMTDLSFVIVPYLLCTFFVFKLGAMSPPAT